MAAASKWNHRPAYTVQPLLGSSISRSQALQSVCVYGGVAGAAAAVTRYG
jgi:hypothetical protein